MKRHEMNGQAMISNRQKAAGSRLLAVGCLLLVASCRAPAPQAGRYQWTIVPHENSVDTIYVIDTATGEMAEWSHSSWSPSSKSPLSTPDWNSIRKQREWREKKQLEQEKQEKEAREKREALVKLYSQMPLEKQVAWAKDIFIYKYKRIHSAILTRPSMAATLQRQLTFEHFETLKKNGVRCLKGKVQPYEATDTDMVVMFDGTAEGIRISFGLSHTPIDSKAVFPAPVTIIDDVKAEIKRQAAKQEEAHAENH